VAQVDTLRFEGFSPDDGLSSYAVTSVARDSTGFLWIGAQQGLLRYDGARIRAFSATTDGLADDYIRALAPDPRENGAVWVGTSAGGLSRFNPATERFTTYRSSTSGLSSDAIRSLDATPEGILWIGTFGRGLVRHDTQTGQFQVFRHNPENPTSLHCDSIRALVDSGDGLVWVGTERGLSALHVDSSRFKRLGRSPDRSSTSLMGSAVTGLTLLNGALWAGTKRGLYRLDVAGSDSGRVTRIPLLDQQDYDLEISTLKASIALQNVLWVGTRGEGLMALDTRNLTVNQYRVESDSPSLPGNEVLSLVEDEDEILWVGTYNGLGKALLHANRFPLPPGWHLPPQVTSLPVMSVHASRSNSHIAWIGTVREGLARIDMRKRSIRRYFDGAGHPLSVVFAIYEDRHGQLWIGGQNRALAYADPASGHVQTLPIEGPSNTWVSRFYMAPSMPGVLWIATRGAGLLHASVPTPVDTPPEVRAMQVSLSSPHVWDVREDSQNPGVLWAATHGGGMNRIDVRPGHRTVAPEDIRVFDAETSCLPTDRIVSIYPASDGTLWLGTFDKGLVRFDAGQDTCQIFSTDDGLAGMDVGAVVPDARGRLWLPTSDGLSLIDTTRDVITTFTMDDGLHNHRFAYLASQRATPGFLFLGGSDGIDVFDPNRVELRTDPSPVALTGLRVDNEPIPLPQAGDGFAPVTLDYDRNDISIDFATLDLRRPDQNRYKVRLRDGQPWTELGTQAEARFFSLSPGRYTIQVAGSNSDGYWNLEGIRIPIQIAPPFWKAWWFWTIVGIVGASVMAAGYQYRLRQLLRVEQTRQRIADDLHDDIGSKISNVALRLDLAGRNSTLATHERQRLTDLSQTAREVVDDLRDTVWIVDTEHDQLPALIARMEQFADQMLREKSYTFQCPDDIPSVPLDMEWRRHIYLFFKEALHNAVRHGQPNTLSIHVGYAANLLSLRIYDDGIGFNPEGVERGRGLMTMRKRADVIGGAFSLDTAPGRGTFVRLDVEIT
jgi:ligand-binding sensor domain-containing protein/signal transduction histidine kinase